MKQSKDIKTPKKPLLAGVRSSVASYLERKRAFAFVVLLPVMLCAIYLVFFSASRWESVSKVTVKSANGTEVSTLGISLLVGANPTVREDTMFLREYIHSHDMLAHLDEELNLRKLYEGSLLDPISRLPSWAKREDFLDYFVRHVDVVLDESSGVLSITSQGFSPEDAQKINRAILSRSEYFLNNISHNIAQEQVAQIESQMKSMLGKLKTARDELIAFQAKTKNLDPVRSSEAGARLVADLGAQLATLEAELGALTSYMQADAPQVVTLKQRIAALRSQMNKESSFVAGGKPGASLNALAADFDELRIQAELAHEIYKGGLIQLEKSRIDTIRKFKSLVVISEPNMPEKPLNRWYWWVVFVVVVLSIYSVGQLVWKSIEEHRP